MLTIVSGFQRCGSSMLLQMLRAGGMPVFHDPGMGFPSFETMRQVHEAHDPAWLLPLDGWALKWLEPQRAMPPRLPHEIRVIWMSRFFSEQAKSAVKFMTHVAGLQLPGNTRKAFRTSYAKDTPKALAAWRARGRVLNQPFEEACYSPRDVAQRVADFLEQPLDVEAMAAAVIRRDDRCLPGFLEMDLIEQEIQRLGGARP